MYESLKNKLYINDFVEGFLKVIGAYRSYESVDLSKANSAFGLINIFINQYFEVF